MFSDALPQLAVLVFQTAHAQDIIDSQQQFFRRKRLLQKIDGAQPRSAHGHFNVGLAGDHHHRHGRAQRLQIFKQRQAVLTWHHHIGEHHVEALGFDQFQRTHGVVANRGLVPGKRGRGKPGC